MALIPVSRPSTYSMLRLATAQGSIMESAWFTNNGPKLRKFERLVRDDLDVPEFVAMANGTLALEAAVALLFEPGSVVAIPSFTFVAVASSIIRCGCKPLFVDIEPQNWTMDYDRLKKSFARIAGVLVPSVFGVLPDDRFSKLRIPVILDNAEGYGNIVGVFGTVDTYSFHATKVVSCGEGGGVACKDRATATMLSRWRDFGFDGTGDTSVVGTNAKMSEFHAALGAMSLSGFEWQMRERYRLLAVYRKELEGIAAFQGAPAYNCVALFENRDEVERALFENDIDSRRYFFPIHKMRPYRSEVELPVTDYVSQRALALPLWAGLKEDTVLKICEIIRGTM